MKKLTILLALFITSFTLNAQNQEAYMNAMVKGLQSMGAERNLENLQASAGQFERITSNASEQWHPQYYAALSYINASLLAEGVKAKDQLLDKAKPFVEKAKELAPNNSEVVALEGFYFMAQLAADPNSRGQSLSGLATQTFGYAMKLNPENPRAMALMAQMQFGTAQFFGSSTAGACGLAQKSIPLFNAEEKGKSFEPTWGIEVAEQLMASCGN
ncbi:hypothetical protein EV198_2880 [Roseivirga ehrenbergii]|uniref:Tetratricopeptide repeat protein n=1 Tax=Roseivirga ehrenbergii (strain DSM 102268 / JCM 13514 / KCTC 12282 / NCIMB 14502 / KMM 6017) TaxID=279360 RepID=A0A150XQN0_ROSEK|nr:hypothetical protein [Roseivirga ehrenbergii]KYG81001.1 hypothetical protein MB14_14555 [Roseivirga ehrenbergii]TCL00864.1 hypothetical protein EV198_2880 [Roseivirga ehrenbergii]